MFMFYMKQNKKKSMNVSELQAQVVFFMHLFEVDQIIQQLFFHFWLPVLIFQSGSTLTLPLPMCKVLSPLELCCQLNNLICFAPTPPPHTLTLSPTPYRNVTLDRSKVEMSWHVHTIRVNEIKACGGKITHRFQPGFCQITGTMRNDDGYKSTPT